AKVTTIKKSKDLSSLALAELIGNLKVHEVVIEKDSKVYRGKTERVKSIALKAKKESSDDENSTSGSDDEEYAMAVRNFKKFFKRKDQKAFIGGSWSDSENEAEDKTNDETCLMDQSSNEKSPSCKIGLGFDSSKASTSGTKPISFVGSSIENAIDGSTIKVHGSTISGSVDPSSSQKVAEPVFSPPMSLRSNFVITRKKLIHSKIKDSMKPSLKPTLKSGLDHHVQNKESPENSSEETVVSKTNQEPPQVSDIHQLIEECSVEIPEEQKQKMENTMFDLVKICQAKEFLCIHDDVDNLIESALDSKLLSINSINSQRLDKKEQEGKNNTSQISSIHSIAPIESTEELEHLLSMGYEHPSITPETESDEVTKSNAENLLPIPSKCEVTLEDEIECDMPAKDVCSPVFTTISNPLFKDNDDLDFSDDESLPDEDVLAEEFKIYSNPLCDEDEINSDKLDPHCFNVESNFVESLLNRDTFIDFSSKFDFSGELAHIKPKIP
nr:UBN2 domain-containing protein [Tanacetum cinerariifolium]